MRASLALRTFLLLAALVLVGCEEEIAAPPGLQAYYTLWGAFDPLAEQQAIRVIPITDTVGLGSATPLPITVTSVDIVSGVETPWRDSVVTFANQSVGHIYVADLQPAFGSRHVFRVVSAEGTETSALVSVPPLIEPIRQTPITGVGVAYPYLWIDAPRLNNVRATYLIETQECIPGTVERPPPLSMAQPVEFGWQTTLRLSEEDSEIITQYQVLNEYEGPLALKEITLTAEVASEDWRPPGGTFDPEILVEPGTLSNVTNGFGFIGAAYTVSVSWRPTPDELNRTSFRQPGFGCGAGG